MKRLVALILTLVLLGMLFPADVMTSAENVSVKPYYVVNFGGVAEDVDLEHIYGMYFTWLDRNTINQNTTEVNLSFGGTTDVAEAAKKVKEEFDANPEGARYISLGTAQSIFYATVVDAVDMERGVALAKDWTERFFSEYKRIGGKLDGIVLDLEYFHGSSYYLNATHYQNGKGNKNIYNQIVANKVYKSRIRPKLVEYGFEFYQNPDPSKYPDRSEIWTVFPNDSLGGNGKSRAIWDCVISGLLAEYLDESFSQPLWKYYPDAIVSDYQVADSYGWLKPMTHYGSTVLGNYKKAGNTSNYNAYDYTPGPLFYGYTSYTNRTNRTNYTKPASYNEAVYPDSAYGNALWDINTHKRLLMSTDTGLVNSHITFFNYGNGMNGYSNTPYYSELILHLGMITTNTFLGYIMENEVLDKGLDDPNPNACEFDYNLQVVDDLMKELTRVAGTSDRKPIVLPMTWSDGYVLSGAYAGGRNIWRITPDTTKVSVENFKVKDKAPTFSVGGLTITFPQGRIIETGKITETGNCGYWVETPANVTPVVIGSADRYSKYPSFMETFNTYKTGVFTAESVKPDTFWEISGSAEISNKSLVMSGDTTLTNVKVPQNITAGDSYAKEQVWEVSVTLPSGNYGTVQLFKTGDTDGGVKISGGKVSCADGSTYTEMSGVNLSAGTYTIKRELNFRNNTSSYIVYDASGNKLGGVSGATLSASAPVQRIAMSTTGAGNDVIIDNYKLYPAGVTTDLEIYDAITGFVADNTSATRTTDTAYRLSWMNASSEYKVANIYNGSTLVEKVEMQPGTDGVATAIVKASASNSAKLSVKVESGSAPSPTNYDNGNFGWTAIGYSLGIAGGPPAGSNNGGSNNGGVNNGGSNNNGTGYDGVAGGTADGTTDGTIGSVNSGDTNINMQNSNNQTPGATQPEKKGLGAGVIALIVVAGLLVLTAGAAVVFWFAVMPKLTEESPAWLLAIAKTMGKIKEKLKK